MKPALLFFLLLFSRTLYSQEPDSLQVNYPLFVYFDSYSAERGSTDSSFTVEGFYLLIDTLDHSRIEGHYLGAGLFLINNTSASMQFSSMDGNLFLFAEARHNGQWVPITSIRAETCGNSYYPVTLPEKSWWRIETPVFKGNFQTTLRYTLISRNQRLASSNEIKAFISPGQLDLNTMTPGEREQMVDLPEE